MELLTLQCKKQHTWVAKFFPETNIFEGNPKCRHCLTLGKIVARRIIENNHIFIIPLESEPLNALSRKELVETINQAFTEVLRLYYGSAAAAVRKIDVYDHESLPEWKTILLSNIWKAQDALKILERKCTI